MDSASTCQEHMQPCVLFCTQADCTCDRKFCCYRCVTFGSHKKHDCIDIEDLQQSLNQFQENNRGKQLKDEEKEIYDNSINMIHSEIKQYRIRIDKLLTNLEDQLTSSIDAMNPYFQNELIMKIDSNRVYDVSDLQLQKLMCKKLLPSEDANKPKARLDAQMLANYKQLLKLYTEQTDLYIKQMEEIQNRHDEEAKQNDSFQLNQFQCCIDFQKNFKNSCYSIAEYKQGQILAAVCNKQINLIDLKDKEVVKSFDQDYESVCTFIIKASDSKLVSCYNKPDSSVKVWDMETFQLLNEMKGHTDNVIKLVKVNDSLILSSSKDKTIILWDIEKFELVFQFFGHIGKIYRALELMNENTFISGAESDTTIRVWDIKEKKCAQVIEHDGVLSCSALLKWDEEIFISGGSGTVKKWKLRGADSLMTQKIEKNELISSMLKLNERCFVAGLQEIGHVIIFEFDTFAIARQLCIGSNTINQIVKLAENKLGIACGDNYLYILR